MLSRPNTPASGVPDFRYLYPVHHGIDKFQPLTCCERLEKLRKDLVMLESLESCYIVDGHYDQDSLVSKYHRSITDMLSYTNSTIDDCIQTLNKWMCVGNIPIGFMLRLTRCIQNFKDNATNYDGLPRAEEMIRLYDQFLEKIESMVL